MKQVDFYSLTREVQDNLLESLKAGMTPKPLLRSYGPRPMMALWLALSGLCAVLLITLYIVGFGDLESALSLHPTALIVVYVALAGGIGVGIAQALAYRAVIETLPYPPGVYFFGGSVIDARERRLRVHPLNEVTAITAGAGKINVATSAGTYAFPLAAEDLAKGLEAAQAAQARFQQGIPETELHLYDPLTAPKVHSPLASTIPMSTKQATWIKFRWPAVVAAALLIGGGVFWIRNRNSDARMFQTAIKADDIATYKKYLDRGEAKTAKVARELLPRAELKVAIAEGTVEAIDAFSGKYPDTDIAQEVQTARQTAMVAAFEKARDAKTLAAMARFVGTYPDHGLGEYVDSANHAIYVSALNDYLAKAPAEGAIRSVVAKLIELAEKRGPTVNDGKVSGLAVTVRTRFVESEDIERSDKLVQQNPMYRGVKSLPSRYVGPDKVSPYAKTAASELAKALDGKFDPELLSFAAGEPLTGELGEVKEPTIVLSYRVEPSGAAYASKKPMGIFVGLLFYFRVEVFVPGVAEPFVSKHNLIERIPLEILRSTTGLPKPGMLEEQIYAAMSKSAFDRLGERTIAEWFVAEENKK